MADEFKGIGNETLRNVESIKSSMEDIAKATSRTNTLLYQNDQLLASYKKQFAEINSSANQFASLQDEAQRSAKATSKAFAEQQKQLSVVRSLNAQIDNLYDQMLTATDDTAKALKTQAENLSAARDNAKGLANEFGSLVEDSSKLDKSTMWFSALSQVATDIPGLRKLAGPFEAAAKAARETVISNAKSKAEFGAGAKTQSAGIAGLQAGFKALGPIISSALGPLALISLAVAAFKALIDMMFEADKQITEIAKSLNINKEAAIDVRDRFFEISDKASLLSNVLEGNLILQKDLVKTQLQFNQLLGVSVDLSTEQNKELAAQLTNANKFLKLNDEEFRGLVNLYTQTGKTVDDIKNSILGTAKAYKLQTGLQIDERKILGDVLKTSNAIKLSIKGGTEALVQATINANKFGSSLDDLDKTADSLLNFEQSISNELEAELLLGRDLNLERARAAALTNDQVALTEEVGNLVKGFGPDFEKNTLAQEAFAQTLGVSRKELADMYTTYQQNEKLSDVQRKASLKLTDKEIKLLESKGEAGKKVVADMKAGTLTGVEFYDALKTAGFEGKKLTETLAGLSQQSLESQSAQEKFDDALEKAKETFTRFVDGEYLDKFADFLAKFVESVGIKGLGSTLLTGLADDKDILQARAQEKVKQYQEITGNTSEDKAKKEKLGSEIKDLQSQLDKLNNEYIAEAKSGSRGFEQRKVAETLERSKRGESGIMYAGSGPKFADGGMITKPIYNATIGEAGPEAVVPLNEFYAKIDQLIAAVNKGGNVYLDLQKVGSTTDQSTYKLNS